VSYVLFSFWWLPATANILMVHTPDGAFL